MSAPQPRRLARAPRRIQRRRSKGWTMPRDAVYVGRGTRFGNGWRIGDPHPDTGAAMTREDTVVLYAASLANARPETLAIVRDRLAGRDLACWCPITDKHGRQVPCHADLLLAVANG